MNNGKSQGIEACARNRADDQLKQFIEHKKREIEVFETFLSTVDWDSLTGKQQVHYSELVNKIISQYHQNRF